MKAIYFTGVYCLLALAAGAAHAQGVARAADSLPTSMQAQIGNTVEIHCLGLSEIPFTPASGSTKTLNCGDSVTIAGVRGDSYFVRTENGSAGYVPMSVLPTDPCLQTKFRSAQLRKQWLPKVGSMSKDEFWKFKNELYLKVTPDDVSAAYKCLSQSMDEQQSAGGMAGYANTLAFDLGGNGRSTPGSDTTGKLMKFTEALDSQVSALALLDDASTAQIFAYAEQHDGLLARYNALVDKHNNFINFVNQRLHDLDGAGPPAAENDASPWRQILAGTLQGIAAFTPPKHLVCSANGDASQQYGDPLQPGYIYLSGSAASNGDCQEK